MKKRSSLSVAIPIASVWFGALVGPSMISGAFAVVYFVPYGPIGLLLPLLSMGVAAVIIAFGANVTKNEHVYNYSDLANTIYGKYSRILSPLLELYMILAMIIGGSSVVSMGGIFFSGLTGLPEIFGAIAISALSIVLVLWGAKLVRASSAIISLVMIIGMLALSGSAVAFRHEEVLEILSDFSLPRGASLGVGITSALALAFSNSVNALTLCSVEQEVKNTKDCVFIGIVSFILNSFAFIVSTLMILPYGAETAGDTVPVLSIVNNFLSEKLPWLPAVYMITMFLALLSSGAPQLNAVAYRVSKFYSDRGIFKSRIIRNLITGVVYFALCIAISTVGLRAIIGKGYAMLGYLAIPLIVIPLVAIMPIKYSRIKKEKVVYNEENKQII